MRIDDGRQHSVTLLTTIDYILREAGCGLDDVDLLACPTGPGSFTGLRVGLATLKGLAMVKGKPIVGVSTLEAYAFATGVVDLPICVLMQARPGYVYFGLYQLSPEGHLTRLGEEKFCAISDIFPHLPEGTILFTGDGVCSYSGEIKGLMKGRALLGGAIMPDLRASMVGILGYRKFQAGQAQDPLFITPHYIQASSAESKVDKGYVIGIRRR